MQQLKTLIKISRPRFWLYSAGTFWVGAIAGAVKLNDILQPFVLICLLYFIIPANIFIYGINDIFDGDTDEFNPKKEDKEHRLEPEDRSWLRYLVFACLALGIGLALLASNYKASMLFLLFLFLAWAYSSLPFRFKAKPFIDAISNVHYAVIGFVAYTLISGDYPPGWVVVSAWCWTASMHIFSAIPDIESDSRAGLKTTAVLLGAKKSLILCAVLWVVPVVFFITHYDNVSLSLLASVYPAVSLMLLFNPNRIHKVYWWFPYINGVIGLILFWSIANSKFNLF